MFVQSAAGMVGFEFSLVVVEAVSTGNTLTCKTHSVRLSAVVAGSEHLSFCLWAPVAVKEAFPGRSRASHLSYVQGSDIAALICRGRVPGAEPRVTAQTLFPVGKHPLSPGEWPGLSVIDVNAVCISSALLKCRLVQMWVIEIFKDLYNALKNFRILYEQRLWFVFFFPQIDICIYLNS